ncbi:MAG: hypothetical protein ACFFAS_20465 [Promethearchaeota archaeon]
MAEYITIKIPDGKIKSLEEALKRRGITPRSYAEAVNILINKFLLDQSETKEDENE